MTKKLYLLWVIPLLGLLPLPTYSQSLIDDAKALNQLLDKNRSDDGAITFEIIPQNPISKIIRKNESSYPESCRLEEGDLLKIIAQDTIQAIWKATKDSLLLVEQSTPLNLKRGYRVSEFLKGNRTILLVTNEDNNQFSIMFLDDSVPEEKMYDNRLNFTDIVPFVINFDSKKFNRIKYDIKIIKNIKKEDYPVLLFSGTTPTDNNLVAFEYDTPLAFSDTSYFIDYIAETSEHVLVLRKGKKEVERVLIEKGGLSFMHHQEKDEVSFTSFNSSKATWELLDTKSDTFLPFLKRIGYDQRFVQTAQREQPASFDNLAEPNLLQSPNNKITIQPFSAYNFAKSEPISLALYFSSTKPFKTEDGPKSAETYELEISSDREGMTHLIFDGFSLFDIPLIKKEVYYYDGPSTITANVKFLQQGQQLYVQRPVRSTYNFTVSLNQEKQLKIWSLLGKHSLLKKNDLEQPNLQGTIADRYHGNDYLRTELDNYLTKFPKSNLVKKLNPALVKELETTIAQTDWQQVLSGEKVLEQEEKATYRTTIDAYRTPITTASDNLQLASQQFASESKRLRKGLNASTIAAGLSDFVVERAQEELNLTFLDRLRTNLLNDTSEFKILFPNTREMMVDFQIDKYQTLLNFAKKEFVKDLRNLGLNFPNLFELHKYEKLKNAPNVFNIFLIYDIANQIYDERPIEEVLLNLHSRLEDRRRSLNQSINLALADVLERDNLLNNNFTNSYTKFLNETDNLDIQLEKIKRSLKEYVSKRSPLLNRTKEQEQTITTANINLNTVQTRYQNKLEVAFLTEEETQTFHRELLQASNISANHLKFQQYQTLVPAHLKGDPVYWHVLANLPFAAAESYFNEELPPEKVIATGLDLARQMAREDQLTHRQKWVEKLAQTIQHAQTLDLLKKEASGQALLEELSKVMTQKAVIRLGLDLEMRLWINADGTKHQKIKEHDFQSLVYLKDVFENPKKYELFDWTYLKNINQKLLSSQFGQRMYPLTETELIMISTLFDREQLAAEIKAAKAFLEKVGTQIERQTSHLQQKYLAANATQIDHSNSGFYYRYLIDLPTIKKPFVAFDYDQTMDRMDSIIYDSIYFDLSIAAKIFFEDSQRYIFNKNYFLSPNFNTPIKLDQYKGKENIIPFLEAQKLSLNFVKSNLTAANAYKERFKNLLDSLEQKYTPKLYEAREHARQFSGLANLTTQVLYALQRETQALETITVADSIVQKIKKSKVNANGESVEVSYDTLIVQNKEIATGKNARKWLQSSQLITILDDPDIRTTFLGLFAERLSNTAENPKYDPKNLALLMNKAVIAINEVDEQVALLKYKKSNNAPLSFSDYYPFIRTTIDLLNIVLTTPQSSHFAPIDQYPKLKNLPKISDESLSLFENIFAEQYPDDINNVVRLLSIIWDIDQEVALSEYQAQQAQILSDTNKNTIQSRKSLRRKIKKNKRVKSSLLIFGSFMANVVAAQTADQVKGAIRAVAVPPGSSSVKRKSTFNASVNAYFGASFHREKLTNSLIPNDQQWGNTIGLSVPIGVSASLGALGKNDDWSISLFVPILDVGGVTAFRLGDDGAAGELPELTFSNLISPGGYLLFNLPKSPFTVGFGAQYGPQVRKITINEAEVSTSAWRIGITTSIDVPIFNLFNRN